MNNRIKTDFLCASSSFMAGFGGVLILSGQNHTYNESDDPDAIAILNDWMMVGQDIDDSLQKARRELRASGCRK
jgi:hypothetical protein